MEGDAPPFLRQTLHFQALSQRPCSDMSAPDSPSMASIVSCSTEGSAASSLRCCTLNVSNFYCTCIHGVSQPKDLSLSISV